MKYRLRLLTVAVLAAGLLAECETPEGIPSSAMAAEAPATKPAEKLSANASIALDKLKPAISKPVKAADSDVPRRAQKAVTKARELINDGKYTMAVPLLVERALGFAPNSAEVHRLLAEAYMQMPDAGKALVHMEKAVKLDGDSIAAQIKLAQLLKAQKQSGKSIVALRTALLCSDSKPENPLTGEALFRLGKLLQEDGYLQAALECFTRLGDNIDKYGRKYASRPILRSVVLRPQRLLMRRGELLLKLGKSKEAAPLLKRAFGRDRTNVTLAGLVIDAYVSSKQFKEAEKALLDLAGQPSLQKNIPAMAARIAVASSDKSSPMRIWKACRAAKRDSGDLAVALAGAADKLGAKGQGAEILKSVMDKSPGDASVTKHVVASYAAKGDGEKVLELLGKMLRSDPSRDDIVAQQLAALTKAGIAKDFARKFSGKIASKPKDQRGSLHYLTARLGRIQGDPKLALAQLAKAVEADSNFLPTYAHLAEIYGKDKQKDKLAELLKKLDKLPGGQESVASYYAVGKIHLAMSNAPEAIKWLKKALTADRRHTASIEALGDAMLLGGRARDAAIAYREIARTTPNRPGLDKRLFDAYMKMRAYRDAEKTARGAIEKNPKDRNAKIMLARVLVASGKNDEASKLLDELKARTGDDRELRLMAIRVDLAGSKPVMFKKDFDRAVSALEKLTKTGSPDADAAFVLARVLMQNGLYDRAVGLWDKVLKVRSDNTVLRAKIDTLIAGGKYVPAADAIRKLIAVMSNDQVLQDQLFKCLKLAGKNDQAQAVLAQRLSQATDVSKAVSIRLKMLQFLQDTKQYDGMQKLLDDWILIDAPRAEPLRRLKIQTYALAKEYAKAASFAEELLKKSPKNHSIRVLLADSMIKSKTPEKVHLLLDKWIAEHGKNPAGGGNGVLLRGLGSLQNPKQMVAELQGLKAAAYAASGKFDQAEDYAEKCIKADPSNVSVRIGLVAALELAKKRDKALKILDRWIKTLTAPAGDKPGATTKPVVDTKLALKLCREASLTVLQSMKKYPEVVKRATEYLKTDEKNIDLFRLRSSAHGELRQPEKALLDIRKMYELQPNVPLYWNNLGYQLADMGIELAESEKLIRQALTEADPASVTYVPPLDSLGWALYKQAKLNEAGVVFLDVIKHSREKKYTHPILYDHAADCFYRLGWIDRAIELWTEAVKLAKEDETDTREVIDVRRGTPGKIKAAKAGKKVQIAPLGKGIKIQDK